MRPAISVSLPRRPAAIMGRTVVCASSLAFMSVSVGPGCVDRDPARAEVACEASCQRGRARDRSNINLGYGVKPMPGLHEMTLAAGVRDVTVGDAIAIAEQFDV